VNTDLAPVLAAEDDEVDAAILRIVFERARIRHPLVIVRDGQEAVDYLVDKSAKQARIEPVLLLLDLKMPRLNGFDVLAWLSSQPQLRHLRAIILSSSWHDRDALKARELGAYDYFVKPVQLSEYVKVIEQLAARWLTHPAGGPPAHASFA
jgi:CheY-like chemotaxis protein